jgi:hypothetical protein
MPTISPDRTSSDTSFKIRFAPEPTERWRTLSMMLPGFAGGLSYLQEHLPPDHQPSQIRCARLLRLDAPDDLARPS